ncbi:MAG: cytochrome b [Gammaproteobacteria bacterium]|nr:cytochrome b [Gammaproteobacteria bacterium]
MQLKNTQGRFGIVAMSLHWLMFVLIAGMLALGLYMTSLPDGEPKWEWYSIHKSFGLLIFVLLLIRILWRMYDMVPPLPDGLKAIERFLAHLTHYGVYLALIILPFSGYVDSSAGDYHLAFFDFFDIPKLIPKNKALEDISVIAHQAVAYSLIALLVMHIAGALKHHLVLEDDVLRRMLPFKLRKNVTTYPPLRQHHRQEPTEYR